MRLRGPTTLVAQLRAHAREMLHFGCARRRLLSSAPLRFA